MSLVNRCLLIAVIAASQAATAEGKTPGETYCFNKVCHRVKTLDETRAMRGIEDKQIASFYDSCEVDPGNPCTLTSSGEVLRADKPDNVASPIFPNGTVLLLWNARNGRSARVRVNNSGPYVRGRLLDVSRATAELLGFIEAGVAQLRVTVIEAPEVSSNPSRRSR
jgi:rare lipoprotein A